MMNVVDIIILVFIAFCILLGLKRGFTRQLVSLVGIFVVIILSFLLKNPISVFLYNNLPFINFGGIFKDLTVINILFYEIIAFLVVFIVLFVALKIILKITKVFEKILAITIVLGIPSKILGAILGLVEGILFSFIAIYLLNLPTLKNESVTSSKVANTILDKTPILNSICNNTLEVFNEIVELKEEYMKTNNMDDYNQKVLNIMIEKNIITKENAQNLIDKGKIKNVVIK